MSSFTINRDLKYTIGNRWIFRDDSYYKERYTLYNIDTDETISLNKALYLFFKLLAHDCLSCDDLENIFKSYNIDFDWVYLEQIFSLCKADNLLVHKPIPYLNRYNLYEADNILVANDVPVTTTPLEAEIHLTHKCNLRCLHCFQESDKDSNKFSQLPVATWLQIFKQFEDSNIQSVVISGGEPLYYSGFNELITNIVDMRLSLIVLTNGTLINDKNIDYLSRSNVHVSMSLDGADTQTNDFLRGKGSFSLVSKAIKNLVAHKAKVSISTTIHKYNYLHLRAIVEYLIENKITQVGMALIDPIGRAKENNWLVLSNNEIRYVNDSIHELKEKYHDAIDIETSDLASKNAITNDSDSKVYCSAGTKRIAVSADGKIYPCVYAFGYEELAKGDLTKEKIMDLWCNDTLWIGQRGGLTLGEIASCHECQFKNICSLKNCRIKNYDKVGGLLNKPAYCLADRGALTL